MRKTKRNPVFLHIAIIDQYCLLAEKKLPVMSMEIKSSEFSKKTKVEVNVKLRNFLIVNFLNVNTTYIQ